MPVKAPAQPSTGSANMNVRKWTVPATLALVSGTAFSQVPQYGSNINLEQARKIYAGAESEARKNSWPVAIAIVDNAGNLVLMQKLDNTQTASVRIALDKAVSAATFRRPTKVFQDGLAKGGDNLRILSLHGASAVEGGLPIVLDGKIVGGIGVSGVTAEQDSQIARAGAELMK
jgi:glc operon protein GlcG